MLHGDAAGGGRAAGSGAEPAGSGPASSSGNPGEYYNALGHSYAALRSERLRGRQRSRLSSRGAQEGSAFPAVPLTPSQAANGHADLSWEAEDTKPPPAAGMPVSDAHAPARALSCPSPHLKDIGHRCTLASHTGIEQPTLPLQPSSAWCEGEA